MANNKFLPIFELVNECIVDLALDFKTSFTKENASYTSPDFVMQAIFCMSELLLQDFVADVNQSLYYSLIGDETTTCSNTSILTILVRCMRHNKIYENVMGIVRLRQHDAAYISSEMLNFCYSVGMKFESMIGACFDGASVMSGKKKGVATLLKHVNPFVLTIHCSPHRYTGI